MQIQTDGFVLRQVKTINGRRMILLFSRDLGKISAGTSVSEKGKSKSALSVRPFTLSKFDLTKNRDYYNIRSGDVIKAFYELGSDVERLLNASYIFEFTDKILPEEVPSKSIYDLLYTYMDLLMKRNKGYETLTLAYLIKAFQASGIVPEIGKCIVCGEENQPLYFNIKDAGIVCEKCAGQGDFNAHDVLLYKINFDIVSVLNYFVNNSMQSIEKLILEDDMCKRLLTIMKEYAAYHLGIGKLKSENVKTEPLDDI